MRLLFISSLFPDAHAPDRGRDSVDMLQALSDRWEIRAIGLRPVLPWVTRAWQPRADDVAFHPKFVACPAIPLLGAWWNHRLSAKALRAPLGLLRRDWHFDAVLCACLYPDACAVASLVDEFHFRFVTVAVDSGVEHSLRSSASQKIIASLLIRASGIVTSSQRFTALLAKVGFRKDWISAASTWRTAAEPCHRLLLPKGR